MFFPGVFLSSRVTGACPVTAHLIMRVNVRTTTSSGFTDTLVTVDSGRVMVSTSSIIFKVRPGDDDGYC